MALSEDIEKIKAQKRVYELIITLKDGDAAVRKEVARELGELGDSSAVPPLIQALRDNNLFVRRTSVESLGKLKDERAVDSLIKTLKGKDPGLRWRAAGALGKIGNERAIEPLVEALTDNDIHVRALSIESLSEIGDLKLLPKLNKIKNDAEVFHGVTIGELAAQAIDKIKNSDSYQEKLAGQREKIREGITKLRDAKDVKALIKKLDNNDLEVRKEAAKALGICGDETAVMPLVRILKENDAPLRRIAIGQQERIQTMETKR